MDANRCVCCDEIIPEGRQYCLICEKKANDRPKRNVDRLMKQLEENENEEEIEND